MPDLFDEAPPHGQSIRLPGADLLYVAAFFDAVEADNYFHVLLDAIHWRQEKISLYGKQHPVPRLSAWYGDPDKHYTYSGVHHSPLPWIAPLMQVRRSVEACAGVVFNSVLANLYRNGADSVAWHSDDEPELGPAPVIASVTLGESRPFQLRHKLDKSLRYALPLAHGSLLLMRGDTQKNWQHQIPRTSRPQGPRINLTFRVVS